MTVLSLVRDLLAVLGLTWVLCTLGVIAGICVAMWHGAGVKGPSSAPLDGSSPSAPAARMPNKWVEHRAASTERTWIGGTDEAWVALRLLGPISEHDEYEHYNRRMT